MSRTRLKVAMVEAIHARVSSDEKRFLMESARKQGITLAEFLRQSAIDASRRLPV